MFLQETKLKVADMEKCRVRLRYENCLALDAIVRSGGLTLLWKKEVDLSILSYSISHIDTKVVHDLKQWCLTSIYGQPKVVRRVET